VTPNQISNRFVSAAIWQLMRRSPTWLLIAIVGGALLFGWARGQTGALSGPVRVVDGDTIVLTNSNTHIRLNGVDAPEVVHSGYDHDDDFGPESRDEMKRIIGDEIVRCELNGERSHERLVGVCFLPDGTNVGAEIIRRGLALDCAHFSGSKYRALEPDGVREIIHAAPYCAP
jgi:endonuclease YncB( thermonuclease family)